MSKLLKFRISKAISSSFHSCRSKDPCTLPQHPVPSFLQNTQFITIDHLLFEEMIHQDNESQLISTHHDHFPIITSPSFKHHVSVTPITAAGQCSSRNGEDEDIDIINEDEEDETETFISSSCKSHVQFSDDSSSNFSQEFDTIYKNTTRRCQKKIGYRKRRDVKNTRSSVSRGMNNIGKRLSISTSTTSLDGELPPRLSVFKKLIPCNVEGKVKESFAIVKKSEDPYEDFKSSMMEMILEKKMFEKNDLEQLLQCFLSLNAKNCHGVIVEAFSEIWKTLFSPNHN